MSKHPAVNKTQHSPSGNSPATSSTSNGQFILDDVKLLFQNLTPPEVNVTFNPAPRATPGTIQNNINPPVVSWNWTDQNARTNQVVTADQVGQYGIQTDISVLFQLTALVPTNVGTSLGTWQSVPSDTYLAWTWPDSKARLQQVVTVNDVGKIGVEVDVKTMFKLTNVNPNVWQMIANDTTTSSPLELSTGAADATAYHDFYRVQIAFDDVWGELSDTRIANWGRLLYAQYDALMAQPGTPYYVDNSGNDVGVATANITGRAKRFATPYETDAAGNIVYEKDASGHLVYETDANGNQIKDANGNPIPIPVRADISGADELQNFIDFLKVQFGLSGDMSPDTAPLITQLRTELTNTLIGCNMLLNQLARNFDEDKSVSGGEDYIDFMNGNPLTDENSSQGGGKWIELPLPNSARRRDVFNDIINRLKLTPQGSGQVNPFPDLINLLKKLDQALSEPYRFDVFAPDSVNFGLLLNYRQRWQPLSYQVGNLVSTIPLAPQETRRYTTKTVIKKSRSKKEIDDAFQDSKSESSNTTRDDSEIVERAKNQTNFQTNASGSFGNSNIYKVSAGMQSQQDQSTESQQTKREFREAVLKAAQEYRNEHRTEVSTEESREDETTSFREIRNPNDELTVTYLFYELQRRYLVAEELHKVTPIILVANDVPAPHEIDQGWMLRYDWILKRTILDKSFLPALEYLATSYTGEELTLQVLGLQVEQQKAVVDNISQQVKVANDALNAAAVRLDSAQTNEVDDLKAAETTSLIKSFFDPLHITGSSSSDGNADRAAVSFAKDTLDRAQAKADQIVSQLRTETTALQVAIDKYTKAATQHFGMLADIDRLRIHIKDNIIYYMQAIWTYEPPDQRYFRLYNIDVPVFSPDPDAAQPLPPIGINPSTGFSRFNFANLNLNGKLPIPPFTGETMKLHQVADIETLIGFKGNYMMFPMVKFDYMTWLQMQNYLTYNGASVSAQDPDPFAGLTVDDVKNIMATVYKNDPASFTAVIPGSNPPTTNQQMFEAILTQMLADDNPDMVVVPSKSLYIDGLPGTHPLLEDFKLIHRAIDVKKAQAEARHTELENLRLAARLESNELGDPEIDKVVVVGSGQNVTVDAGQ
jgi:hypothetical protein